MPVFLRTQNLKQPSVKRSVVKSRGEKMLQALELGDSELSILLCDDARIQELNRDYRNKDRPTDVLAFALQEVDGPAQQSHLLGDVIISLDTARRQANTRSRFLIDEVTLLLAHGLLHLVGYDHQTNKEERIMNDKTEELIFCASNKRIQIPSSN